MDLPILLIALGGLFLVGLAADTIGRRTRLPRVTVLLACGIAVGGSGFDLIPPQVQALYEFLSVTALTMVAFVLGNALTRGNLARHGRAILSVSAMIVLATVLIVALGLWLLGVPLAVALVLGAIATATDPAATQDTIRQSRLSGPFVDQLKGIVAIDDAWGVIVFSVLVVLALGLGGEAAPDLLRDAAWEIGGALMLGAAIGLPSAYLTGRLRRGEPMLTEGLGIVFLTAGLSIWAGVSFLLAGMTAGAVIANFARHHGRAFHEIEHVQWPFMILFFLLAGASLKIGVVAQLGMIGLAYVVLRIVARLAGGWMGGALAGSSPAERPWYGLALLPQAGVAVGMALVAAREFPQYADLILSLTIATTVIFELIGPVATLWAIRRVQARSDAP
ncbi:transporter (CPA2 family) [Roseovarius halotolerans]|uniref:Sodium/hydrogen exchanger family protein n=1 Tax=Roseovarius halotolerans TaxID=505353 RepID=A0A1X6ZU30_9RHOB|nr:cation:proton antiporter [Roseovarius halotolerans]RKT27806.1 transporter (CPA2 family) [Roseovarius halotolerans]SLN61201.1 Sodium/hydrogen exchanger family protein [Roseovarius halotolerans]